MILRRAAITPGKMYGKSVRLDGVSIHQERPGGTLVRARPACRHKPRAISDRSSQSLFLYLSPSAAPGARVCSSVRCLLPAVASQGDKSGNENSVIQYWGVAPAGWGCRGRMLRGEQRDWRRGRRAESLKARIQEDPQRDSRVSQCLLPGSFSRGTQRSSARNARGERMRIPRKLLRGCRCFLSPVTRNSARAATAHSRTRWSASAVTRPESRMVGRTGVASRATAARPSRVRASGHSNVSASTNRNSRRRAGEMNNSTTIGRAFPAENPEDRGGRRLGEDGEIRQTRLTWQVGNGRRGASERVGFPLWHRRKATKTPTSPLTQR